MSPAEQNDFMVGIVKTVLQIKPWPVRGAGNEAEQQQLTTIRRQERARWVEKNLTDEQRLERGRQEIAMRNGQLRGTPTCFGTLE